MEIFSFRNKTTTSIWYYINGNKKIFSFLIAFDRIHQLKIWRALENSYKMLLELEMKKIDHSVET